MTVGGFQIRQARMDDADAIRRLTRDAYARWVPVIGREPLPMSADYAEALRNHGFDLAYVQGTLAALIETVSETDHLLIENVAVAPSFQGRGLGRKLMGHAEQLAAAHGHGEIRLYTNKLFVDNLSFYGNLGYAVEREEAFRDGVIVHMRKAVAG